MMDKYKLEIKEDVSLATLDKALEMIKNAKEKVKNSIKEDVILKSEREGRGQKNIGAGKSR